MNDYNNKNISDESSQGCCFYNSYESIDLVALCDLVIQAANDVYDDLLPGMPKSVYRLKLLNRLFSMGMKLEAETSQLSFCVGDMPAREIIVINGVLIIECLVTKDIIEHHKKRITFDIQNNNHEMGMLINFANNMQDVRISNNCQRQLTH